MPITTTVNGVDLDRLSATIDAVVADPALARFQFRADNHWIDGGHSRTAIQGFFGVGQEDATRTEPFAVDADEPPVLLGHNLAPNAGEYLLHALAACLTERSPTTPPPAASPWTAWNAWSTATWTCAASSASTPPSAPASNRSGSPSPPPATSTTTSSPSSPTSPTTHPSGTASPTPSP